MHEFEAITVQPVHVIFDEADDPVIFTDPDDMVATMYGCRTCGEVLDTDMNKECAGHADLPAIS